ncbi:MAG: RnfABCDGE type electron transport complex subunit D [Lachnospiraceae bacterium]|nr:RnfABCDGE type electron transport complex subunit D [Lachnospiraceae bacterium]
MNKQLHISVSPHIYSKTNTQKIMLDVIIALLPATAVGTWIFGLRSLAVIAVSVCCAVLSEFLFDLAVKKPNTISDLSAVVTGLLLALTLPANIPLWQVGVGAVFSIVIIKGVFGGIGQNFANPAITGRIFMLIAFGEMAKGAFPRVDTVSSATPLAVLEAGEKAGFDLVDMLIGTHGGAIGETATLALVVGGIYLIARKVIMFHTPVCFIATVFLFTLILTGDPYTSLLYTMGGGVFIGAIFMATDYATTPVMPLGKVIFGVLAGIITVLIRFYGNYPEGVSFAILLLNILTPYIDRWTAKKPFGGDVK